MTAQDLFAGGLTFHRRGELDRAAELYARALGLAPALLEARVNLAACLIDLGRAAEAVPHLETVLAAAPDDVEARNNLGNALQRLGRTAEAVDQFARALRQDPDNAAIRGNLARARLRLGHYEAALADFAAAPPHPVLRFANALALPIIPACHTAMQEARARLEAEIDRLAEDPPALAFADVDSAPTNFHAAYHGLNDVPLQRRLGEAYARACPELRHRVPARTRRRDRLRVGFASAFLRGHTIARLNRRIMEGLDARRFEVLAFALGGRVAEARAEIAAAELDILVYPDIGMEPTSYFLAFARLAPLQCVAWGHPVTTGLPEIDCFLSTSMAEPADAAGHYSERLVQFPTMNVCVAQPELPDEPLDRTELPLEPGERLYLCPQSLFKVHPDFDAMLGEILARDPRAAIVLIDGQEADWSSLLRDRFAHTIGAAAERIRFVPRRSGADYLRLLMAADVVLDTPHFCGGLSSYESFACGKVVVTLPSPFLRGRLTLGLYRQLGLEAGIARDSEDYVRRAVELAQSPGARAELERAIAERHGLIFDDRRVIEAHETFFLSSVR